MSDKSDDGSVDKVTKCPDCGSTHLKVIMIMLR